MQWLTRPLEGLWWSTAERWWETGLLTLLTGLVFLLLGAAIVADPQVLIYLLAGFIGAVGLVLMAAGAFDLYLSWRDRPRRIRVKVGR